MVVGIVLWAGLGAGWLGRLPGDIRFTLFGKTFFLPFASTILLSLLVLVIARFL